MQNGNGNTVLFTVIGVATLLVALVGATFAYFTASITNSSSQSISIVTAAPVALVTSNGGTVITMGNAVPGTTAEGQTFSVGNTASGAIVPQSYDLSLVIDTNTFTTECTTDANTVCSDNTTLTALKDQLELTIVASQTGTNQSTLKMTASTDGANGGSGTNGQTAAATYALITKDNSTKKVVYNLTNGSISTDANTYAPANKVFQLANDQVIVVGETQTYTMSLNFKEVGYNQNFNSGSKTFTAHLKVDDVKMLSNQ